VVTGVATYDSSEEELQEVSRATTPVMYDNGLYVRSNADAAAGAQQPLEKHKVEQLQQQVEQLQQQAQQAQRQAEQLRQQAQQAAQQAQQAAQQAQQAQQEAARLRDLLSQAGIDCDAGAVQLKEQLQRVQAVEQQQQEQKVQMAKMSEDNQRLLQQLAARQPGKCVVHGPADYTPERLAQKVSEAAHIPAASIEARRVWAAPAEYQADNTAGGTSSSSGNGNNSGGRRRRLAVWVLTL
jgi:chromosome segregation ATPase